MILGESPPKEQKLLSQNSNGEKFVSGEVEDYQTDTLDDGLGQAKTAD